MASFVVVYIAMFIVSKHCIKIVQLYMWACIYVKQADAHDIKFDWHIKKLYKWVHKNQIRPD